MRTSTIVIALLLVTGAAVAQQTNEVSILKTGAARIWIPVAGHTAGNNGTFFMSEISVTNLRAVDQKVLLYWLPQGSSGAVTPVRSYDVGANRGFSSDDFVDRLLLKSGVGAIEVVAATSTGAFDPQGLLHVTSRIWTPRPDGADGTMSQTLPAVAEGESALSPKKMILGMKHGTQFRLNVGVLNPASTTQHFKVETSVIGPSGIEAKTIEFDVRGRSIEQVNVPVTSTGVAQLLVQNTTAGAGDWHTWASSIDNQSGDAWSQMGFAVP